MADGVITLALDDRQFRNGLKGALRASGELKVGVQDSFGNVTNTVARSFESSVQYSNTGVMKITRTCMNWAGAITAVVGAYTGLSTVVKGVYGAIQASADQQTLQTAFIPLLGSVDKAKSRMEELVNFATTTPFQLPEIANASRTLESLTEGAMSTGEGLRLVGDLASANNRPFEEMATTVGRLYSGLMNGRPIGEVFNRLSELGILSPQVRTRLEQLQKAGEKGSEVWSVAEADLSRFNGGMLLQSETWNGKVSTLSDGWAALKVKFGEPIQDVLAPFLDAGINKLGEMAGAAVEYGESVAGAINSVVAVVSSMSEWYDKNKLLAKSVSLIGVTYVLMSTGILGRIKAIGIAMNVNLLKTAVAIKTSIVTGCQSSLMAVKALKLGWVNGFGAMKMAVSGFGVALKTAIASSGIGLAVIAIGEIVGWMMRASQIADEMRKNNTEFSKMDKKRKDRVGKLSSKDEFKSFAQEYDTEIESLGDRRDETDDKELKRQYIDRINLLINEREQIFEIGRERVRRAEEEKRVANEVASFKAKIAESEKDRLEVLKKINELEKSHQAVQAEKAREKMPLSTQEVDIYGGWGSSREDIYREIARRKKLMSDVKISSYMSSDTRNNYVEEIKQLYGILNALDALDKKKEAMESKQKELLGAYTDELFLIDAKLSGDKARVVALEKQLAVEKEINQLKATGMSSWDAMDQMDLVQSRRDELKKKNATNEYNAQMRLLRAKAAGDSQEVARLERLARQKQLYEEMVQAGVNVETAKNRSKNMAMLEQTVEKRNAHQSSFGVVADSLAKVGGGGNALTSSSYMSEARKQTKALQAIEKNTMNNNRTAVLAY